MVVGSRIRPVDGRVDWVAPGDAPDGLRVLLDDRDSVSPGVKFKDADLIGVPTIVVVGRGIADDSIEVKDRRSGDRRDVPLSDAVAELVQICQS